MEKESETITLTWRGFQLSASITRNWLSGRFHHIELRADCPLLVTHTGYRSEFVLAEVIDEDYSTLEEFVTNWLDKTNESTNWFNKNRQMSFDL